MSLLTACILISISLIGLRFVLSLGWKRSRCPRCRSYSISRKKRTSKDRLLGKILVLPLERYRCTNYQCEWEGLLIYKPQTVSQSQPSNSHLKPRPNFNFLPSLEDGLNLNTPDWFASEQNLISAFERDEFTLYYQPSLNLATRNIDGVGALLRWQHPERGIIYPKAFIPVADDSDFILLLGHWIFSQACQQLQKWHEQQLYPLNVSVNLSVRQFYQPSLAQTINQVLEQTGLKPSSLEIEVSEKTIMQNLDLASTILLELQSIGIRLIMDNVGIGNMPHRHLRRLALDTLKIDQSLIHNLNSESDNMELIRAYVQLGQGLNLDVIAEGVETYEELQTLRLLDCVKAQGYLFDRPLSAEDATDVLQANWLGRGSKVELGSII